MEETAGKRKWKRGLVGRRFGKLTVVARDELKHGGIAKSRYWLCRCDCGKETTARVSHLKDGNIQSCGCKRSDRLIDLTGRRYGRLVCVEYLGDGLWRCRCDCGNFSRVAPANFKRTKSCGCLNRELARARVKHGHAREKRNGGKTKTWRIWVAMRERCYDKNSKAYHNYGERGITICAGWHENYLSFLRDMGESSLGMSIDRKDNDGGYWCGHCEECINLKHNANCRWATAKEQARNTTRNRLITLEGKTLTAVEWAERFRIPYALFMSRLYLGWSVKIALTTHKLSPDQVISRARAARRRE